jgi:hypothetical protein
MMRRPWPSGCRIRGSGAQPAAHAPCLSLALSRTSALMLRAIYLLCDLFVDDLEHQVFVRAQFGN